MIDFLAGVPGKLKTLADRLSSTWAAKLDTLYSDLHTRAPAIDNLDAAISSRASAASLSGLLTTVVNSIQHGEGTIPNGEQYLDVAITAVNTNKAIVLMRSGSTVYSIYVLLTSSTNVRVGRLGELTGTCVVSFTVLEFK